VSTRQNRLLAALRPLSCSQLPQPPSLFPSPAEAYANPHILVDVQTGRVLEHEEAFRKWYPASLTKLMTVYTTFDAIRSGQISSIRLSS
jgi:D-alanyl-D-alanine carboxypeptidase